MKIAWRTAAACIAAGAVTLSACSSSTDGGVTVADIEVFAGDGQSGVAGTALAQLLVALVSDAAGQPVSGATVTWSVLSGNATASPATSTSDASGHATTTITLGNVAGLVTVQATAAGAGPVSFTATSVVACDFRAPFTFGAAPSNGTLSTSDCLFPDNSYIDYYDVTVAAQQAARFRMTSATFDTFLFLFHDNAALDVIGGNDDDGTSTNSEFQAIVAPGSYVIGANSYAPSTTGSYTLSSVAISDNVANCAVWYLTPGLTLNQTLAATDCAGMTAGIYADLVAILLPAGRSITITQTSAAFNAYLRLYDGNFVEVAFDDNTAGGTNARLTYLTPAAGLYIIEPTSAVAGTGAYTLTLSGLTAAGVAMAPGEHIVGRNLLTRWPVLKVGGRSWQPRAAGR